MFKTPRSKDTPGVMSTFNAETLASKYYSEIKGT